jgi:hypothetical protein
MPRELKNKNSISEIIIIVFITIKISSREEKGNLRFVVY